jgi:predicted Zn-dependent protease
VWLVDEKANRAASRPAQYFRGERGGLDPVRLLALADDKGRELLDQAQPNQRAKLGDVEYLVYRAEAPGPQGVIFWEAYVDPDSLMLRSLQASCRRDGKLVSLAAVQVVAVDKNVDEDLFVVGDTLTEDGRVGKITDAQGIVSVKPVMASRWTPVSEGMLVMPGDWLRTDPRGANAIAARLVPQTQIAIGPGALVEVVGPKKVRVHSGDVKVVAAEKAPVELIGPDNQVTIKGTQLFRVEQEKLVRLDKEPLWLKGFEGRAVGESIGSLVANIEGRNTPLTVGYHKVTVDIRDQIARTVVEESFVNHTAGRLEGVFHFPLPQDASISGFGMWIGDELVEADVVEKQRAREIYEEILRERRDPGLLEWTGGNIFKARVFPIEPHSEKRIKITYTQVLPLRGNSYRYSYALQSEMLRQHPLRELAIDVKLNSVAALKDVSCPTHLARADRTEHSAHVEFTAQQYTPARDFEVLVELDKRQSDVALIPHRRGEDGYFMVLVTPPPPEGDWRRDVLPDGRPLDLIILADTSASMDAQTRQQQADFIAAVLGSLTPKDTVNLAGCDVECDWVFDKSAAGDAKSVDAIRQFLARRISLGWTDLDKAFAAAFERAGPKTRILYVGDGITTTGDADPQAFAKRLKKLYDKSAHHAPRDAGALRDVGAPRGAVASGLPHAEREEYIACYAVSAGSNFESGVLKAIASLGGGSMRQITGEHGPAVVARELLSEMARPALKDVKVSFSGIRTARVYPAELPNVAAGSQQIVLGRYLPEGKDQSGEVIVTGTFDGKPVRWTSKVSLKDAEEGNSFIPRLWARMHLDYLLSQGSSQGVQDEVVALSEEYHIMTPYTSFLVLESDADRERFKVKRSFQMRDGQKFFAAGRDNANYELVQQQMKRAGSWRLGLRRSVLAQLSGLGRNPNIFQPQYRGGSPFTMSGSGGTAHFFTNGTTGGTINGGLGRFRDAIDYDMDGPRSSASPAWGERGRDDLSRGNGRLYLGDFDGTFEGELSSRDESLELLDVAKNFENHWQESETSEKADLFRFSEAREEPNAQLVMSQFAAAAAPAARPDRAGTLVLGYPVRSYDPFSFFATAGDDRWSGPGRYSRRPSSYGYYDQWHGDWLGNLFTHVTPPPPKLVVKPPKTPWAPEARAVSESLLRTDLLAKLKGGLEIDRQSESFEPRFNELTHRGHDLAVISPSAWLVRTESCNTQTTLQWCDAKERGIFGQALQLGRLRASTASDHELRALPFSLTGNVLATLESGYQRCTVELKPQGADRTLLVLKYPENPDAEVHMLVDTTRHVILSIENRNEGKATTTTKFDGFVEVAGVWWAGQIETLNDKGQRTSLTTLKYRVLAEDAVPAVANKGFPVHPFHENAVSAVIERQLAGRDQVQFLREPSPKINDAKRALAGGKPTFDDRMTLAAHFAATQQWTRVTEHFDAAEKLSGKPGMKWVRNAVLNLSRRREELRARLLEQAAELAKPIPNPQSPIPADQIFLADHLVNQSSGILENNELLKMIGVLKPVYERQPAFTQVMKRWRQQQINWLRNAGQQQEALALQKQLAADYPRDYSLQTQYAQALASVGEYEAAYDYLRQQLGGKVEWLPSEADGIRGAYSMLMQSHARFAELAKFLEEWILRDPEGTLAYEQYLGALVRLDRVDEADALAARWLKQGQLEGKVPPPVAARLQAAVGFALGQGYDIHTNRIDEKWLTPLADATLFFARHKTQSYQADRIMGQSQFQQSDECRRIRKAAVEILLTEIDNLKPAEIGRLVNWITPNDPAVEQPTWRKIADGLRRRWDAEGNPELKNQLGQSLVQVLSGRLTTEEWLSFLRVQIEKGPQEHHAQYVNLLFEALLSPPWSAQYEDEALSLLPKLSDAEEPFVRLLARIAALHRLTDRMVEARYQALMQKVEHQEKLTRTELRAKQQENRRLAQEGLCDRLNVEKAKHEGPLGQWINAECLYLNVLAGRNLKQAVEECWEVLGNKPVKLGEDAEPPALLDAALKERLLTTLMNLAIRKTAAPETAQRLLTYLDAGIAGDPENLGWKLLKYQLLVALDRPKDLEQTMREWVRAEGPINQWRLSLGYLLAEQGKLDEAVKLFEAVAAADELGPREYRTLADWYMAVNRRDEHQKAKVAVYKMMEEWRLSDLVSAKLRPWQQRDGKLPTEFDPEVLAMFAALFEKSGNPQNYLHQLQQFYRETRDFRLLAGLADAVVGHTAGKVYPFLQGMSGVLGEIRDEATADSLVAQIAEVRKRAKTTVDQRAVDLLEVQVERRAAELLNQPGPHADKALAALQRAFQREWSPGEPRLMADFLAGLGHIPQPKLADQQVRQLEALHGEAVKGTIDRLHIAYCLARTRWAYGKQDAAIDLLLSALAEYQEANQGVLPTDANNALSTLVGYFESRGHFARGEEYLFGQLKRPVNQQQSFWLKQRLYELYQRAIRDDGEVSLGKGQKLYQAVEKQLIGEMETGDSNYRYQLISRLLDIYSTAHQKKIGGVADDLRAFAFGRSPAILNREINNRQSLVGSIASRLRDIAGPRDGLRYLIERIEQEPRWLRYTGQDGWRNHGYSLAQWRSEVKDLGDLEPRLLKIVLDELRRDLESRQSRNQNFYWRHHSYYWAEKEKDFRQVAEEVYAKRKNSGAAVLYIADYLFHGLEHYDRAIEMLLVAYKQDLLEENGQSTLITYLHERGRYGESIAVLLPLVERRPDAIQYRVWLMTAYFQTKQPERLLTLLKETDEHFHKQGRWQESNMAALAQGCLNTHLFEQSAAYYEEVIALHQRTQPNRGIGNGTLSNYYGNQARAYAGLKRTAKAVEAACAAIVSWGSRRDQRAGAIDVLQQVIQQAPDLDSYVTELDKKVAETGLDNAIVRKAIGQVYLARQQYDRAIAQLTLACQLQPNDTETHRALVECYDKQGDKEGVVRQLLESVKLSRRDIALYQDLGRRYDELKDGKQAERAYTSIVEMLPNESEGHAALAEVRQKQNRWNDAIGHWQQVARIRALEPTGLLKLAEAQIHQKRWDAAADTLRKLESKSWPSRFGDLGPQVRQLWQRIEQGRKTNGG